MCSGLIETDKKKNRDADATADSFREVQKENGRTYHSFRAGCEYHDPSENHIMGRQYRRPLSDVPLPLVPYEVYGY